MDFLLGFHIDNFLRFFVLSSVFDDSPEVFLRCIEISEGVERGAATLRVNNSRVQVVKYALDKSELIRALFFFDWEFEKASNMNLVLSEAFLFLFIERRHAE